MSESFDGVMEEMREKVASPYWINMADRLQRAHESEIVELQRQYEQNVIELQRAHRREMETVRDPQRIGGTLERDSFEYALEQLREFRWQHATNDNDAIPYINGIAKAHEHEMEHLRKKCFREGYEAGQRSMDAEELRETLIETLEDKDGNDDNDSLDGYDYGHHRCDQHQVSYDELGNERRKAVCELRNMQMDTGNAIKKLAVALGLEWNPNNAPKSVALLQNRIIHLLGGDEPNLQKSPVFEDSNAEDAVEIAITDELREFATDPLLGYASRELHVERITAIADRIDEQFYRVCEQQEKVLQAERDELQEKCDRLKAKVEHQREQLAVYATMCDFDAIRALKRERNEHKHRADNAEGHVKSLERRLDAAHETYCALLNDAAREFRALTEERDELLAKLDDYDKAHAEVAEMLLGRHSWMG